MNEEYVDYIKSIIEYRLSVELNEEEVEFPFFDFGKDDSDFSKFISHYNLELPEILTVLIAMLPQIAPGYLTRVLSEYHPDGSEFPEFGGVKGTQYRGIIPTGDTVLYIIAGNDIERRSIVSRMFEEDHIFAQHNIVSIDLVPTGEPRLSGKLLLDQEFTELFLYGYITKPKLGPNFPAQLIETDLSWQDLVLNTKTQNNVNDILIWLQHNETLLTDYGLKNKLKPGYRVMFFGPPGVGKTLTASLLGKQTERDVYRIDLSMIVSKFIGETEKNLSNLFDKAQNKNWILFFDEADAIFGKRTGVRDAHDKYANQEVSYLLQRIESYPGLVILASNYKSNIDKAFTRRFQSIIEFENPNAEERLLLWQKYIPPKLTHQELDLIKLSKDYEVTGANIVNIVQHACLQTLNNNASVLSFNVLQEAIKREFFKEGKMI